MAAWTYDWTSEIPPLLFFEDVEIVVVLIVFVNSFNLLIDVEDESVFDSSISLVSL